jgi:DUF1009 family protein
MDEGPQRLGLIAGQGMLPLLVARGMKNAGARVCCVGLRDQFDPQLPGECDEFRPAGVAQLGRWIRTFRGWDVSEAVMVGRVAKVRMHDPLRLLRHIRGIPDWRAINLWYRRLRHDHRNAAILAAVADELAASGITLIDSTTHIAEHMATDGVMTRTQPAASQRADIEFGWPLLKRVVELEVGQSIAVRDRDVIAVEAVEGTDAMIDRAGTLCKARGWTLLKTARAGHDMRADVPTIGVETIDRAARAGCGCIAVGAGRVILVDKPAVLAAAERSGVALFGASA